MNVYQYNATRDNGELVSAEIEATSVGEAVRQIELLGLRLNSIHLLSPTEEDLSAPASDEVEVPLREPSDLETGDSATSENADENASENTREWRKQLEVAIARKSIWLPALQAMLEELPPSRARIETAKLLSLLKQDFSVQQLLESPRLIRVLPLLTTAAPRSGKATGRHEHPIELSPQDSAHYQAAEYELDAKQLHEWLRAIVVQQEAQIQRWRAFAYPVFLFSLAAALFVAMAFFLIPIFRDMYADFAISLPGPTLLVLWISEQVTQYALRTIVVLSIGGLFLAIAVRYWRRYSLTNRILGRVVAGTGSNLRAMSQLIHTLAELLSLGAPLNEALAVAGGTCRHALFANAANQIASELSKGRVNFSNLRSMRILPSTLAVALSGESPNVPLLRELAVMYGERTRRQSSWLSSMLPSASVLVVGVTIGFVVITLFMPLVTLVSALA